MRSVSRLASSNYGYDHASPHALALIKNSENLNDACIAHLFAKLNFERHAASFLRASALRPLLLIKRLMA